MSNVQKDNNCRLIMPTRRDGEPRPDDESYARLQTTLSVAVPIAIVDFKQIGGPQDYHLAAIQEKVRVDRERGGGADILFGKGELAQEEQKAGNTALLIKTLAILAFQPGGVTAFGLHFEARGESEILHD